MHPNFAALVHTICRPAFPLLKKAQPPSRVPTLAKVASRQVAAGHESYHNQAA